MKNLIYFLVILVIGCEQKPEFPTAQQIIDSAILKSCNTHCDQVEIQFNFRDRTYRSLKQGGQFIYERISTDSLNVIRDVLDNDGFRRFRNDSLVNVVDTMAVKYANSVNSVHYFIQLPYGLNDPAVIKEFVDTTSVKGEPYYRVKVFFQKEGGGSDYEDIFLYWFHRNDYSMDYFAYSYETDGGGVRFREAYNVRGIKGIRFADYRNYKPESKDTPLTALDSLFEARKLQLLSTIESTDIKVNLLAD